MVGGWLHGSGTCYKKSENHTYVVARDFDSVPGCRVQLLLFERGGGREKGDQRL